MKARCLLLKCSVSFALAAFGTGTSFAQCLVVEADTVHTMGPSGTISDGVVLVENHKIVSAGPASKIKIPAGCERVRGRIVTPGFIDAKSSIGLSGLYNVSADQDQDEDTDPNTADVRALDSFNPRERLLEYTRNLGVTTVQAGPGPDNPIAGQAGIFKTAGENVDQMAVRAVSAMVFNLGERPKVVYGGRQKAPATRMATAALIRKALQDAQHYSRKWEDWEKSEKKDTSKRPSRDLKLDALSHVTRGEWPAIFTAHREDDIVTAVRIASEFKLRLIIAQATEGYLTRDAIKRSGAPVIVGPVLQRLDAIQTENASVENAALLAEAGIPIAFGTGFESYVPKSRVLLFEAAVAMANGLAADRTLRALTIGAAQILGIQDRVGSLEASKDADVVVFDGDPFEYTTHVTAVVEDGQVVYKR